METASRQQSEQPAQPESRAQPQQPSHEVKAQAEDAWRGMRDVARARIGETQQESLGAVAAARMPRP